MSIETPSTSVIAQVRQRRKKKETNGGGGILKCIMDYEELFGVHLSCCADDYMHWNICVYK